MWTTCGEIGDLKNTKTGKECGSEAANKVNIHWIIRWMMIIMLLIMMSLMKVMMIVLNILSALAWIGLLSLTSHLLNTIITDITMTINIFTAIVIMAIITFMTTNLMEMNWSFV